MTDWRPLGWALLMLGIASIVAGAYLTGTTGDVSVLLITGMGATTAWLALHEELQDASTTGAESEPGESA
ncbi:hypothetical protein [Salinarchaeum laminariae]|uniref:hypothetical protein n=1 Tax=Salinarchaeum laminariae TaxID=869888 RepID=UPI0020BD5E03|nr:hypothetical protein [Salinarchaeum laminariae]